jgi:hypothetical protein
MLMAITPPGTRIRSHSSMTDRMLSQYFEGEPHWSRNNLGGTGDYKMNGLVSHFDHVTGVLDKYARDEGANNYRVRLWDDYPSQ